MEFKGSSKDAVDQDDLHGRLKSSKSEIEEREQDVLNRPGETYCAKFWPYLKERSEMMASHMVADVRKEAGMAIGDDGKVSEKWRVVSRKFQKKKLKQHFFIHLIW